MLSGLSQDLRSQEELDHIPTQRIKEEVDSKQSDTIDGPYDEAFLENRSDSTDWLIAQVTEILSDGSDIRQGRKINWHIQALHNRRKQKAERLETLRQKHYPKFCQLRKNANEFLEFTQIKKIKKLLERLGDASKTLSIINNELKILMLSESSDSQESYYQLIVRYIDQLDELVETYPKIKVFNFISLILSEIYEAYLQKSEDVSVYENEYAVYPVRAWKGSAKYHISNGCHHYPRVQESEDIGKMRFFSSEEDAMAEQLSICTKCSRIMMRKPKSHEI